MAAVLPCTRCGFETPRAFPTCAKCGEWLAEARRVGRTTLSGAPAVTASPGEPARAGDAAKPSSDERAVSREVQLRSRVEDDAEPPLIGQAAAIRAIRHGIERAFALGAPSVVSLVGARGSGKTRLLFQAAQCAAHLDAKTRVVHGATRQDRDGSYAPFARIFLDRFDVTPSLAPQVARAQMSTAVSSALGTSDVVAVAETTHFLGHVMGVPFPESPFLAPLKDAPEELHARAMACVRRIFEADASSRPTLILLDDMHLADAAAWDVLSTLCEVDGPVAFVLSGDERAAARAQALKPAAGVCSGPIVGLSEAEVRELLLALVPGLDDVPEPLAAALTHRSKGNPSSLRELTFALWEAGLFVREGERIWVEVERLADRDMPVTTEDAIRARLLRLDDFERATASRAAVVGEVFWDDAVLATMRAERHPPSAPGDPLSIWADDADADALAATLERLEDKGFLEPVDGADLPGVRERRFALPGTRRFLYETMPDELRIARHAVIARWLAVVAGPRRSELSGLVAPHLERAGQRIGAGRAYFAAAQSERAHRRTARALGFVAKALELLPPDDAEVRIEALHEHGSLLAIVGQYDRAIQAFSAMLRLAWSIGARGKGGAALNRIARVHRERGEDSKALVVLERALALFRDAGDLRGLASCQDDLAQILMLRGELGAAIRAAREALEIRRAHGDRRGEALSLTTLGRLELRRGNVSAADALIRAGLDLRQAMNDHEGILQSYGALGRLCFEQGDRVEAIRAWQTGLLRARESADRRSEALFLNNLGEALLVEGRLDAAGESLARAKELVRELGDRRAAAEVERNLGRLSLRRGDPNARERLTDALRFAEAYGSKETIALVYRSLGQLEARTLFDGGAGGDGKAEERFLVSVDLFRELRNEKEAARSLMDLGQHLVERGDLEGARERLGEARAILRQMGLPEAEAVTRLLDELPV
jgi:tetratricopeptide (TPR) repeat protein